MPVLLRNHFLVCDGIDREVASFWIPYYLGPDAVSMYGSENVGCCFAPAAALTNSLQGQFGMYYRSRVPLTPVSDTGKTNSERC